MENLQVKDNSLSHSRKVRVNVASYLQPIMPTFLANRQRDLAVLETALAERDEATVRSIAHRLRGNGGGYGLPYISELGLELGEAAKQQEWDKVGVGIGKLRDYLARLEISFEESN